MLTITPALEAWGLEDFGLWPCAGLDPEAGGLLLLGAEMTDDQLGLAMAALATSNLRQLPRNAQREPGAAEAALQQLAAKEHLIAPGGLVVSDNRSVIRPGCCAGLENWRDWLTLQAGADIWLGHDPDPHLTPVPGGYLLHQDQGRDEPEVLLPIDQLPQLLAGVRDGLAGFLGQAEEWARRHSPDVGEQLGPALQRLLAVVEPC